MSESRLEHAERNYHESAGRLEHTRRRVHALAAELAATRAQCDGATFGTVAPAAFAELLAKRELLVRAVDAAREEERRQEAAHAPVKQTFEQTRRNYLSALDRLQRAERQGDRAAIATAQSVLAALAEER